MRNGELCYEDLAAFLTADLCNYNETDFIPLNIRRYLFMYI